MLARLAGFFAVLFGAFYFAEGLSWLVRFASGATSRDLFWAHYQTAVVIFDLFSGGGLILAGAGMLLCREWGRKAWLAMLLMTVFLHFLMMLADHTAGFDVRKSYGWAGLAITVTLVSWALLTRPAARARFR